jgi:NadR type nicotinamide-nucleotide adenylyltransferase
MEKRFNNTDKLIKAAITGPESTGKSTLASTLAQYYKTVWVPEYAREYLNKLKRPYTFEDVEKIAAKQIELEDKLASTAGNLLFCDTELIVIKIWMEFKYLSVPDWINREIGKRKYDVVLLCDIDIPWMPDPLRENPDLRSYFFNWFKREIEANDQKYFIISGNETQRKKQAVEVIDKIIFAPV